MSAGSVTIDVNYHPVPPGGLLTHRWDVWVDGVSAHGFVVGSQRKAFRAARRRVRAIENLNARVDDIADVVNGERNDCSQ